jgi:hypothetical protein
MQNTRLNNLVNVLLAKLGQWLTNPWRRLSLILISFLFGVFLGSAIPTSVGQAAEWDIVGAGILLLFTEAVSRFVYGSNQRALQSQETAPRRSLLVEVINYLKIGLTYSLFLEAFKIGS